MYNEYKPHLGHHGHQYAHHGQLTAEKILSIDPGPVVMLTSEWQKMVLEAIQAAQKLRRQTSDKSCLKGHGPGK